MTPNQSVAESVAESVLPIRTRNRGRTDVRTDGLTNAVVTFYGDIPVSNAREKGQDLSEISYTYEASPRREPTWWDDAACTEIGHQPFYAEGHPSMVAAEHRRALAVCRTCPVQAECLEHALATDERFGVWGGTTEAQRAQMRRGRTA